MNDTADVWEADILIQRLNISGDVVVSSHESLRVLPGGRVGADLSGEFADFDGEKGEFLVVDSGDVRGMWFGDALPRMGENMHRPDLKIESSVGSGGVALSLTARSVVRDVILDPSRWSNDGRINQNLITLLPGECVELSCEGVVEFTADILQNRGGVSVSGFPLSPGRTLNGTLECGPMGNDD